MEEKEFEWNQTIQTPFLCIRTADRSVAFRGGKSGQHRAPHRLTGGVCSLRWAGIESVAENNFPRKLGWGGVTRLRQGYGG